MADIAGMLADLRAESDDLDAVISSADPSALSRPTPAEGWSAADSLGHLWFFDREGRRALESPAEFGAKLDALFADPDGFIAAHLASIRSLGDALVPSWQDERRKIIDALAAIDPASRVPWYGPSMSPMSFGTARLMETWAHGQDIADALGVTRTPTDRLRHIAHLGVSTRAFSYAVRGQQAPDVPVFVCLTAPSGAEWTWGDPDAPDSVRGPALDFCLRVTQRRLVDDLGLEVTGAAAREWMTIAQAFAGGPTLTDASRRGLTAR
ncbi:MAG TPA: TIGR03084 family metal-binding protein [Mycobacteriales bacterium]|nr:TIGR03084 family metal-binding protein [Mycobacteriales bacterium]